MQLNESVVEEAALSWFRELGYTVASAPHLAPGEIAAERSSFGDVVLVERLRDAIGRLNPTIPRDAREEALRKVLRHDAPSLIGNNRAFHRMLRDGVPVEYRREDGSIAGDHIRLIDFDNPNANDWLTVNQFTVIELQNNRRPDIVVFVNGLPAQMKLPSADAVIVAEEKIRDYLLNAAHPDNGGKAAFFLSLGFQREDWGALAIAFRELARTGDVSAHLESTHGRKYILDGHIQSPGGRSAVVRTIWIVDRGDDIPRLVTAYPYEE